MTSRIHSIAPRVAIAVAIVLVPVLVGGYLRHNQSPDGTFDSVAVYDIHAHTRSWIRGAIRGETRLTADGRPVVWDLVLKSPDRYAWHRTDWNRWGYTREIQRCLSAIR